jgi:hypothetical protein
MTEPPAPELQFDKAEFASNEAAATVCAGCQAPIAGDYYDVNGQTLCPACKAQVEQVFGGQPGAAGLLKALGGGVLGGLLGALVYYAVRAVSGYEIGIIAIAVGWLVGKGVNWGSGRRGGALYQALAMVLTYVAIVSTYVPAVLDGLRQSPDAPNPLSHGIPGLIFFALFMLALPFLAGLENVIGIIIIAIGLYEAWKINKRVSLTITGPFHAAFRPAVPPGPPPAAAAGAAPGP